MTKTNDPLVFICGRLIPASELSKVCAHSMTDETCVPTWDQDPDYFLREKVRQARAKQK